MIDFSYFSSQLVSLRITTVLVFIVGLMFLGRGGVPRFRLSYFPTF